MTETVVLSKKQVNLEKIKYLSYVHLKGRKVYICPKCKKQVPYKSHHCPFCGEYYSFAVKVPLKLLKNVRNGIATEELHDYVHIYLLPKLDLFDQQYLNQHFTIFLVSQGPNGYAWGTATILSGTFTVNLQQTPVAGNVLILCIQCTAGAASPTVSSITQPNVSWHNAVVLGPTTAYLNVEIWYGIVSAGAGAQLLIALNAGTGANASEITDVCEFSGLSANPFDQNKTNFNNSGTSSTTDSGTTPITTTNIQLWIGCLAAISGASFVTQTSPSNSFILLDGVNQDLNFEYVSLGYCYRIVSSKGAADVGTTLANANQWAGCIATFKGKMPMIFGDGLTSYTC
jgi:hypothetical protein